MVIHIQHTSVSYFPNTKISSVYSHIFTFNNNIQLIWVQCHLLRSLNHTEWFRPSCTSVSASVLVLYWNYLWEWVSSLWKDSIHNNENENHHTVFCQVDCNAWVKNMAFLNVTSCLLVAKYSMDLKTLGELCKMPEMLHNAGHILTSFCPYETTEI